MTDILFITNRLVEGRLDDVASFTAGLGARLTTGMATVKGGSIDRRISGDVAALFAVQEDNFEPKVMQLLAESRHVLLFVHGFANSFPDALSRAAFNRDWFAATKVDAAQTTVLAFAWPSPGRTVELIRVVKSVFSFGLHVIRALVGGGFKPPAAAEYLADQKRARQSGAALLSALDQVRPALAQVQLRGGKVTLMVHSMGHEVLAAALALPQAPSLSPGEAPVFDNSFLCAGDLRAVADGTAAPWLDTLRNISAGVHVYFSQADDILKFSHLVNGSERLGQEGGAGPAHAGAVNMRFVDCTGTKPEQGEFEDSSGHYYYRRDIATRLDIAKAMAGGGADGSSSLP